MMNHWTYAIPIFICAILCNQFHHTFAVSRANKDPCEIHRNGFIESLKLFEQCAIQNAVPVSFCRSCFVYYVDTLRRWQELEDTKDPKDVHQRCIDRYINFDTLNIVWQRYKSARHLWNDASCTSCFVDECDPDTIPDICQINKNVMDLENRIGDLQNCIDKHDLNTQTNQTVCDGCLNAYNLVANQYQGLHASPHVCFEVIDKFNRTGQLWYGTEKCPKPTVTTSSSIVGIVVIIGIVILCAMAYGGFVFYTRYRQQGDYSEQIDEGSNISTPIYT